MVEAGPLGPYRHPDLGRWSIARMRIWARSTNWRSTPKIAAWFTWCSTSAPSGARGTSCLRCLGRSSNSTPLNKLILNVDKEKLKTAPGFEKDDKRPDFSDTLLIRPRGDRAFLAHRRSKIKSQGKEGMYFGYMVAAGCSLWLLFIAFLWQQFL